MVMGVSCPNIRECKLVVDKGFNVSELKRFIYIDNFCKSGGESWRDCTRFVIKSALNFCPDFILPDTDMTPDEVIDKFDEENA